jgi:DNA primase
VAYISKELIDEIKNKNDIVSVISSYIPVIKKGRNYLCLCPFHNDTTPSMHISSDKQIYKCFACGAGGNVISFVENYEKISFFEALKKLANNVGISLDQYEYHDIDKKALESNKEYYDINKIGVDLFSYLLTENEGMEAYNYLKNLNINDDTIKKFNIGFAGNNQLIDILKNKNVDMNKAAMIGLININNNEYQNAYKNRLIFPIFDVNNNCLGFSARILNGDGPKYINTKETLIFDKGSVFYNINNAVNKAIETKEIFITEGAKDVIAFDRAGLDNTVCVMGTALSKDHIKVLKKLGINSVVLAFDSDEAGKNATYKAINILSENNIRSSYLLFDNLDPEEYLNKNGREAFISNTKNTNSSFEFKINYEFSKINLNNYSEKKKLVMKLVNEINDNLDTFDRYYYYDYLAHLSGISDDVIKTYVEDKNKFVKNNNTNLNIINKKINTDIDNASSILLFFMINDKKYYDIFKNTVGTFSDVFYRDIYNVISAYYLNHDFFELHDLYNKEIDNKVIDFLINLDLQSDTDIYKNKKIFDDALNTINMIESLYIKQKELSKKKDGINDPIEKAKIVDELLKINNHIRQAKEEILNK